MKNEKQVLEHIFQVCAELIYKEMLEPIGW